ILTGLYATVGIQGALLERTQSGKGQKLDISLYDSAVSALVNIGSNYLMSGEIPKRLGNHHANIVPYQTFQTMDGEMVIRSEERRVGKECRSSGAPEHQKKNESGGRNGMTERREWRQQRSD